MLSIAHCTGHTLYCQLSITYYALYIVYYALYTVYYVVYIVYDRGAMTPRNIRQFGMVLPEGAIINCGIGPKLNASYASNFIWPNRFMEGEDSMDINIAGTPSIIDCFCQQLDWRRCCGEKQYDIVVLRSHKLNIHFKTYRSIVQIF